MFKEAFLNFNDTGLIVFGFVLFMLTFLGALIWTFLVRDAVFYEDLSRIPLNGGDLK